MARLGEVPLGHYYGTVDATPHAGRYFDRTGDIETIAAIWPNIKAALHGSTRSSPRSRHARLSGLWDLAPVESRQAAPRSQTPSAERDVPLNLLRRQGGAKAMLVR
jgi:glycogen debranching enzyme